MAATKKTYRLNLVNESAQTGSLKVIEAETMREALGAIRGRIIETRYGQALCMTNDEPNGPLDPHKLELTIMWPDNSQVAAMLELD